MIIAPSLLSADFGNIERETLMLNQSMAELIHVDVMDGRFVPNISFGFPVMEVLRKHSKKPLDVHLMIVEPEKYALRFAEAGADMISFHLEATSNAHRLLQEIKAAGKKAGVAINPQTEERELRYLLEELDFVNVMSVNPGFGGQKFISSSLKKIEELAAMRTRMGLNFLIEVDGGVDLQNAGKIVSAGADILVAGSSVFRSDSPEETIAAFFFSCT